MIVFVCNRCSASKKQIALIHHAYADDKTADVEMKCLNCGANEILITGIKMKNFCIERVEKAMARATKFSICNEN